MKVCFRYVIKGRNKTHDALDRSYVLYGSFVEIMWPMLLVNF